MKKKNLSQSRAHKQMLFTKNVPQVTMGQVRTYWAEVESRKPRSRSSMSKASNPKSPATELL